MLVLLTNKCNLACKHCLQSAGSTKRDVMGVDLFRIVLAKAKELGARVLNIAGGEPTTLDTKTLKSMLDMALSRNFLVILETNGNFLSDIEKTEMLADLGEDYPFNFFIQISAFSAYYTNRDDVLEKYNTGKSARRLRRVMGTRLSIADERNTQIKLKALGRCASGDMLEKAKEFNSFPSCINSALITKQIPSNKPCLTMEESDKFCVPMVDPNGGVHMGESIFCKRICDITDSTEDIVKAIMDFVPCGTCANYHWHFDNPKTEQEIQVARILGLKVGK